MKRHEKQPPYLFVADNLRLRQVALEHDVDLALPWYRDMEVLKFTAGIERDTPYDRETVAAMFGYLSTIGECYIIEVREEKNWRSIGDVTLAEDTLPIVIGDKTYWGRGIGGKVLTALIRRARAKGFRKLRTKEIYTFNARSLRLFRSLGFREIHRTSQGLAMELVL